MLDEREGRKLPPKTIWVTYGLQSLSTEKFLEVVQKILDGELILLKTPEVIPETHGTKNEMTSKEHENTGEYYLTKI